MINYIPYALPQRKLPFLEICLEPFFWRCRNEAADLYFCTR